ncbi:MAG: PilZ domain-containing protein [Thermodesulfobacteriota bacterium]
MSDKEKRKLRRRPLLGEVRVRPSGGQEWVEALVLNISRGGIGLYASQRIRKGQKVDIRISYLEGSRLKEVEQIPGKVRWVQAIGSHLAIGIMFEEKITRKTFPVLNRCLAYAAGIKD